MKRKIPSAFVLTLLLGELFLAVWFYRGTAPVPTKAFLIKNGPEYLMVWNLSDGTQGLFRAPELARVLNYAKEELGLQPAANPNPEDELESIWLRREMGRVTMFWKIARFNYLNRLTFKTSEEAELFQTAFRRGAYSPSPHGHAILLTTALSQSRLN